MKLWWSRELVLPNVKSMSSVTWQCCILFDREKCEKYELGLVRMIQRHMHARTHTGLIPPGLSSHKSASFISVSGELTSSTMTLTAFGCRGEEKDRSGGEDWRERRRGGVGGGRQMSEEKGLRRGEGGRKADFMEGEKHRGCRLKRGREGWWF